MGGDQALVEQARIVDRFDGGHVVPAAHEIDLYAALGDVGHHLDAEPAALAVDVLEEGARAGVDSVRGEHNARAAVELAVPALVVVEAIAQRPLADCRLVVPHALVDLVEVDVVDPGRGTHPKAGFRNCWQRLVRMRVHVVDESGAKQQGFERGEAGECGGLLLADVVAMGHARRVGRRKAQVLGHAAHHGEDGVGMDVDVARDDQMPASVDCTAGIVLFPIVRTDERDAVAPDADDAIGDGRLIRLGRHDRTAADQDIERRGLRVRYAAERRGTPGFRHSSLRFGRAWCGSARGSGACGLPSATGRCRAVGLPRRPRRRPCR